MQGTASGPARRPRRARRRRRLLGARRLHRSTTSPATIWTRARRCSARRSCCGRRPPTGTCARIVTTERARDGDYALNDLGVAARHAVPRGARLRRLHPPRHLSRRRCSSAARARRSISRRPPASSGGRPTTCTDLDYTPLPLIAPRQRRRRPPVHPGAPRRVGEERAARALSSSVALQVAGRRVPLHAELHAGRREQLLAVRAVAVRPVRRSISTRRRRRSTTTASASTAGARSRSTASSTRSSACAAITRTRRPTSNTFFSPAIAPPAVVNAERELHRRVAAVHRGLSR